MGATYTRQSSYTDGDVITAAHTNDEFNQLLAAFQASTGHTHDGTANEGGPITKLLGNTLTFGAGTAGTDITITFDGETNDGELKWMEDEDYFEFSDDILVASTEKLQFRDTAIYINSSADGQLDLVADTEIQIAASTIDMDGDADISGNLAVGGNLTVTGTTTFNGGTMTLGDAATDNVVFGADVNSSIIPNTDDTYDLGSSSQEWRDLYVDGTAYIDTLNLNGTAITSTASELNILDGVTATATELNILDGVTATTAELNILDGVTSTATELNILDGVTSTTAELNILDGVTATASELNILDGVTSTTAELNILDGVTSTATELNIVDGDTSATLTTLADADRVVVNDAGTMKQVALTDFETYFESALDTLSNVTTVGTLNSGAISSGFGNIDVGSSNLTATGTVSLGATSFNDNNITNVGDIAVDSISADATDINVAVSDNSGTAFTIKQGLDAYLIIDTGNTSESISIGTGVSGTAITLGHSTSEVTVADNLTVTGDLTVSGTTTTVNSTTVNLNDHNIVLDSGNSTSAVVNGAGITIEGGSGDDATFTYNTTGPQFELKLGSSFEDLQVDKLIASELDISGNVDVDGTLETDALSINSTAVTSTGAELNLVDGSSAGTIVNSKAVIYGSSGEVNATTLQIAGTSITSTAAELNILDGVTSTAAELNILDGVTSTTAELNILDGVTSTATEINVIDGDTSATSTTLADADRFVTNDNGTMKQVALTDVKTYLTSAGFTTDDPTALAIALG